MDPMTEEARILYEKLYSYEEQRGVFVCEFDCYDPYGGHHDGEAVLTLPGGGLPPFLEIKGVSGKAYSRTYDSVLDALGEFENITDAGLEAPCVEGIRREDEKHFMASQNQNRKKEG